MGEWDKSKQAQEYRNKYRREHYSSVGIMLPIAEAKAYREACGRIGIQSGDPIRKAIQDVLSGRYKV